MKFKITALQALSALIFVGFTYYRTRMIDALGSNRIDHSVPIITTVLLLLFLMLEIFEHHIREKEFAKQSARVKSEAARAFLTQSMAAHAEKNEEQQL